VQKNITELWDNSAWNSIVGGDDPEVGLRNLAFWNSTQDYFAGIDPIRIFGIDDFFVPSNKTWYITEIYTFGFYGRNTTAADLEPLSVTVEIYETNPFTNTPNIDPSYTYDIETPYDPFTLTYPDYILPFDPPLALNGTINGTHYWLTVKPNIVRFQPNDATKGYWYWNIHFRSVLNEANYYNVTSDSWETLTDLFDGGLTTTDSYSFWFYIFGEEIATGTEKYESSSSSSSSIQFSSSETSLSESNNAVSLYNFLYFVM